MRVKRVVEIEEAIKFEIGDIITVQFKDGKTVEALAVKPEFDEENGETMLFIMDCYPIRHNAHGISEFIREYIERNVEEEFKRDMVKLKNGELFRLPTEFEITGDNSCGESESDAEQFAPMKDAKNRFGYLSNNGRKFVRSYWLENMGYYDKDRRVSFDEYGESTITYPNRFSLGIRPVFKLKIS